jgi:hypothetical protein
MLVDGGQISGYNSSSLTISAVTPSNAGTYWVVLSNLFGVVSNSATLTVITNPTITLTPAQTNTIQSEDVTFSVTTPNSTPLGYQWWFSFSNSMVTNLIPDATNSTYTELVAQPTNTGIYVVVATNQAGTTNASAALTVLVPPWITNQPANVTNNQSSTVTFSVGAFGTTNLSYQWYQQGTNIIPGATNAVFNLTNIQGSNALGYRVVVSNSAGTNASAWAWLSVILPAGNGTTNGPGFGTDIYPPTNVVMIGPANTSPTNPAVYLWGPPGVTVNTPISIRASASSVYSDISNVVFYFTGTNNITNTGTDFIPAGTAVPGPNTQFALPGQMLCLEQTSSRPAPGIGTTPATIRLQSMSSWLSNQSFPPAHQTPLWF